MWLTVWHLVFLVSGRAVSDGPAAGRQAKCCRLSDLRVGLMVTCLAVGIGAGSMLAGRLVGRQSGAGAGAARVRLDGRRSRLSLYAARGSYGVVGGDAGAAGRGERPVHRAAERLSAAAQARRKKRGASIATNNFYNTLGRAARLGNAVGAARPSARFAPSKLVLLFGVVTLLATVYIARLVAGFPGAIRALAGDAHSYRIRMAGAENVPLAAGRRCWWPTTSRTWMGSSDRRLPAALRALHGLAAVLRDQGDALVLAAG